PRAALRRAPRPAAGATARSAAAAGASPSELSDSASEERFTRGSTRDDLLALGVADVLDLVRRKLLDAHLPSIGLEGVEDLIELHVDRGGVPVFVVLEEKDEQQRQHADEKMYVRDPFRRDAERRQRVERDDRRPG